jgi:hypothetical protein
MSSDLAPLVKDASSILARAQQAGIIGYLEAARLMTRVVNIAAELGSLDRRSTLTPPPNAPIFSTISSE